MDVGTPPQGELIDQLCAAITAWAAQTGHPERELVYYGMRFTGGAWFYPPVGHIDPTSVPEERRRRLRVEEILGHHTVEQFREWLRRLTSEIHLHEPFLITALVAAIDQELEALSETYAQQVIRAREEKEKLQAVLADPKQTRAFLAAMNAQQAKDPLGQVLDPGAAPYTETTLTLMLQEYERFSLPSLEDQRRLRADHTVWHELTGALRPLQRPAAF
jgi:hypothetical protein